MKKSLIKIIAFVFMVVMLLSMIQVPVLASAEENRIILQKAEKEFIIYYKDMVNDEFNFAFSANKKEDKDNLIFISSVKDELQEEKLNVAYINENLYEKYFKDNKAYIWIKDTEGNYKVEADEINLSENIMTDSIIDFVNNTTKRINGEEVNDPDDVYRHIWTDDEGVKHTVILSQYFIEKEENTRYYYQLVKIAKDDTTSEAAQLYDLAEKLKNGITSKYEQFETQQEFYDLYQKLQPKVNDSKWQETETGEIREPEDTVTGDKYIIWLKADNDGEIEQDAKFLSCYQEDAEEKIKYTPVETVKSPKTYDSIALIVAFVIVIALIMIVLILRKKSSKTKHIAKH